MAVLKGGSVSDDTQLTLATCEGLVAGKGRVRPELIAERFATWFREGRIIGVGATTLRSLRALSEAPLAFVIDPFEEATRVQIRDVVRITHNNDEAYAAALAVVLAVKLSLGDQSGHAALSRIAHAMPDSRTRAALLEIANSELTPREAAKMFGTSGFAAEAVPVALCAALTGQDVLDMLRTVVSFGGDTDTTASIAGQVLGARVGAARLPAVTKAVNAYEETLAITDAFASSLGSESWWRRLFRREG